MARIGEEETIRQRSGWLIPLTVFAVTAVLSGAVLIYYLAPTPAALIGNRPAPTAQTDRVELSVGGVNFTIPSNYIRYRSARKGGPQKQVALFAMLPDFRGYTDADAQIFSSNAADSPIVYILLHDEGLKLSEQDRFQRIYLGYIIDPHGHRGPFGLTQYVFRDDSGYRGEDLFVGRFGTRMVVLRCVRMSDSVSSPSCLRETRLAHHAGVSYRFKRAQLSRWREVASGVDTLVHSFVRGK
ncbi:MAG TPA: hypothetical protein VHU18_07565 [Rhizomicrobium sp.]|jgi:hypothetical protein|nr:hypothetical protein [Rhizomicrobium sp.]